MRKLFVLSIFSILAAQLWAGGACCRIAKQMAQGSTTAQTIDTRSDSIDIIHSDITIDLSDFTNKVLYGDAVVTLESKVSGLTSLSLDLLELTVDSVLINNVLSPFSYNDTLIEFDLPTTLNTGDQVDVRVFYHGAPLQFPGDWGGFYWTNNYAFNIGVSFLGNPHNYGRVWFPCLDNFVERHTYDINVITEPSKRAYANGLLDQVDTLVNGNIMWRWSLTDPIPSYLASVAVADYKEVRWEYQENGNSIPVLLAALENDTSDLRSSFINLDGALTAFIDAYGPYEFDRVGYCVVPFSSGAMEHATNIAYMSAAVNGNLDFETLMAHELSHHWWGNLATCATQEDMWLNEGWASYSEYIFLEHVYGSDEYSHEIEHNHEDVLQFAHVRDDQYWPVSGVPFEHTYSTTVYSKGADVAHTLRGYLGDDTFFDCITGFLADNAFDEMSSEEFRDYLSTCSGQDMNPFFNGWVFEPGFPHFAIDKWIATPSGNNSFEVVVHMRQKLNNAPNFFSDVPLELTFFDDQWQETTESFWFDGECQTYVTDLPFEPIYVALDYHRKISDAVTEEAVGIGSTGTYDFESAKLDIIVHDVPDTALVHVQHHFVAPDGFKQPWPGLHLSDYRYWNIGGIIPSSFKGDAIFLYNGSTSQTNGHLDNTFISNSEDSLVILYRASVEDDWELVDSFFLNVQISTTNKVGRFTVYNIQPGQYAMAIYDHGRPDLPAGHADCINVGLDEEEQYQNCISIHPNPSDDYFVLTNECWEEQTWNWSLKDAKGRVIKNGIRKSEKEQISTTALTTGSYIVTVHSSEGKIYSKKVIIK